MKQTNLSKFSGQIKKLAQFLFFSAITISVWGQTEQKSESKICDSNIKTVDCQDEIVSPKKTDKELKSETDETDNQTETKNEEIATQKKC